MTPLSKVWQRHRLAWQLASPLHIGFRTSGTIARTRLWVPGRNVWGALIDTLARAQGATPQTPHLFETLDNDMKEGVCFESWFLTPHAGAPAPLAPWQPQQRTEGWYYGDATEQGMQRLVLGSAVTTAIAHGPDVSDEGMLFETEYIAPRTLHAVGAVAAQQPIWLVGHIWIAQGATVTWHGHRRAAQEVIAEQMQRLSLGGEQAKGYGRLVNGTLAPCASAAAQADEHGRLVVEIEPQQPLPLLVVWAENRVLRGKIEPIVGRATTGNRHGATLHSLHQGTTPFCWLPGSVADDALSLRFDSSLPGIATFA